MKKKTIVLLMVLVLVFGCAVGGTLAWLIGESETVTNTFTVGKIEIELKEHKYNETEGALETDETTASNEYHFVPGDTLPKDPYVTVKAGSEACYLFIKVSEQSNTYTDLNGKIISWNVNDTTDNGKNTDPETGWVPVPDKNNFWYRTVAASDSDQTFYILTGDANYANGCVTVNTGITTEIAIAISTKADKPQISFDAAAVQSDNISTNSTTDVTAAWAKLPSSFTGETETATP